jgi:hypothetical protein
MQSKSVPERTLGPMTDLTIRSNSENGAKGFRRIATATAKSAKGARTTSKDDELIDNVAQTYKKGQNLPLSPIKSAAMPTTIT